MATLLEAVRGDTFNGLTGYKRPLQSNPTRVPGNQPSFRGVPNEPGKDIRAPAIKASSNHPDRKTNITIPYARVTPVETPSDIGRLNEGDVAFCSKDRPGLPGYACGRMTRLAGVDALNRWMGPDNWSMKNEEGKYRYILEDPTRTGDDWRSVPMLGEWSLDGIVMSSDEKDSYYSKSRDGNLYNIAIQGPAVVNNGFLDSTLGPNQLTPYNQGQMSRFEAPLGDSYMDQRIERSGLGKQLIEAKFDFAADYRGAHYHLYPLQSFDREARPMNELYCGLVATEYTLDTKTLQLIEEMRLVYNAAEDFKNAKLDQFRLEDRKYHQKLEDLRPFSTKVDIARTLLADAQVELNKALAQRARLDSLFPPPDKRDLIQKAEYDAVEEQVNQRSGEVDAKATSMRGAQAAYATEEATEPKTKPRLAVEEIQQMFAEADKTASEPQNAVAIRAKTAFAKMGWWVEAVNDTRGAKKGDAPASFAAFRWVFFTSKQAWGFDKDLDQGLLPGEPRGATKRQKTTDPYNNEELREEDFRHMVGAYHLGKVIDCKAGKMPFMAGGPTDTGFRLTANVNIEWRDWRALRRHFNSIGSELQFGDKLTGCPAWNKIQSADPALQYEVEDRNAVFQWPTKFVPGFNGAFDENLNMPISMDFLYKANSDQLRAMDYADVVQKARALQEPRVVKGAPKGAPKNPDEYNTLREQQEREFDENGNPILPGPETADLTESELLQRVRDRGLTKEQEKEFVKRVGSETQFGKKTQAKKDATKDLQKQRDENFTPEEQKKAEKEERDLEAVRNLLEGVTAARFKNAPEIPMLPANPTAEHFAHRADVAAHRLKLMTTPVSFEEISALLDGAPISSVAKFVQAPPAPPPAAVAPASTSAAASASTAAPAASVPVASASSSASAMPVLQAPSAPGKKRRAGGTDVFAGIFGGNEDSGPQPLNPAHRSDAPAGSGSTGRSFQRRANNKPNGK